MYQKYKSSIFVFLVFFFLSFLNFVDRKIDSDFNSILLEARKTIETNLSNEERGSLNLNPKLTYISLSLKLQYVPYIDYKLRYCYSYLLKEGYPEKTFRYYY